MENSYQKDLEELREQKLIKVTLFLSKLGFELDKKQAHISGERYLLGYKKLVLLAKRISDNKKVIIKLSNDPAMIKEINDEWNSRQILKKINFAYHVFFSPPIILFTKKQDYTVLVTEFIEQESIFLDRPLPDQFFIALKAFEAQEAIHATTYEHAHVISKVFGIWTANTYLQKLTKYSQDIEQTLPGNKKLLELLQKSKEFTNNNLLIIDLYSNFLTHWDFVPHNFRIREHDMYLLDHSSLRFGNKYEGWARFINFMILYNYPLEKALLKYVKDNRGEKEYLSLRLMRVFRLTELIWYYTNNLGKSRGDLKTLNKKRIDLWTNVLKSVLEDGAIDRDYVDRYKQERNSLRSEEEKQRQVGLH